MSEQSVSRSAEARRKKDHEASRKETSVVKALKSKSSDSFTRADQHATVVGLNLGSNRNAGSRSEQEDAPENPMMYSADQTERRHSQAPVVENGAIDNRKTVESKATLGRHVQSDDGFRIAERRSASVAANRKETEKVFADRRKKSSVNR